MNTNTTATTDAARAHELAAKIAGYDQAPEDCLREQAAKLRGLVAAMQRAAVAGEVSPEEWAGAHWLCHDLAHNVADLAALLPYRAFEPRPARVAAQEEPAGTPAPVQP